MIRYTADESDLMAADFLNLAMQVWPGSYEIGKTEEALHRTLNITARVDGLLVGCLRILTDGYYFGTITELLVLPSFQGQGIGSQLLRLAKEYTPTILYFGAQPGLEHFYEKNGCQKGMQSYVIDSGTYGCC